MKFHFFYQTPKEFDDICMLSDGEHLIGLWFMNSNDASKHTNNSIEKKLPIFQETGKWLDVYFQGKEPDFIPNMKIDNETPFRKEVLDIMKEISFGTTITYSDIAKKIANQRGIKKMSSQAVGGAVGWNPICIIIPCHRVIGSNGNLTGYGGGLKNKVALLKLEKNDMSLFFIPKKGNKL